MLKNERSVYASTASHCPKRADAIARLMLARSEDQVFGSYAKTSWAHFIASRYWPLLRSAVLAWTFCSDIRQELNSSADRIFCWPSSRPVQVSTVKGVFASDSMARAYTDGRCSNEIQIFQSRIVASTK